MYVTASVEPCNVHVTAGELDEDGDVLGLELALELGEGLGVVDVTGVDDALADVVGAVVGGVVVDEPPPHPAAIARTKKETPITRRGLRMRKPQTSDDSS